MNNKDKEMLTIYRNVQAYTIQALEKSIESLNDGVNKGSYKAETVELLKERKEELEEYLVKIELDF